MSNIGESLKRKFGPLPVWGWAIIGFILVYYYRNKFSNSTTLATQSLTPTDANSPQSPIPLAPGESVYDPNTGALVNTPGANAGSGDNGTGTVNDLTDAMNSLADAIANGITVNPGMTATEPIGRGRKIKGLRSVKRKPKHKKATGKQKRPRSVTHVKRTARTQARQTQGQTRGNRHSVTPAASAGDRSRRHPKTPITTTVTRQRPVASHPTHAEAHNTPHQQHGSHRRRRK